MAQLSAEKLKTWFVKQKRSFPWRESPTPYAVWISEIMLQQTRASVVVSYFLRWMELFPTIDAVAQAPIEDLIKAWEGLGYYSRVRNIQKAAIDLQARGGNIPSSLEDLLKIQGIGPYTAGAIASFAFHQKAAAVDGNVSRVMSRYFGLEGVLKKTTLEEKTLSFLPDEEPWVAMEALIELGATLCQKNPKCEQCPLQKDCIAFLEGKTDLIPLKKKKQETIYLHKQVFVIVYDDYVLIEKKKEGQVLGGLMEFPSLEYSQDLTSSYLSLSLELIEDLPEEKQSFTKYQLGLFPSIFYALEKKEIEGHSWEKIDLLSSFTFSSGHKRILQKFLEKDLERQYLRI